MLKRLDVPGLSVEGEESEAEKQQTNQRQKTSGYNPYETPRPASKGRPSAVRPETPRASAGTHAAPPAVKPPPPRSWLGRIFRKD
jgi:hypothetical protein